MHNILNRVEELIDPVSCDWNLGRPTSHPNVFLERQQKLCRIFIRRIKSKKEKNTRQLYPLAAALQTPLQTPLLLKNREGEETYPGHQPYAETTATKTETKAYKRLTPGSTSYSYCWTDCSWRNQFKTKSNLELSQLYITRMCECDRVGRWQMTSKHVPRRISCSSRH